MKKVLNIYFYLSLILLTPTLTLEESYAQSTLTFRIDSLIDSPSKKPFNGIILIAKNNKQQYVKIMGYANVENKLSLKADDQFIIGSISKQITAVLVLREFEKNNIHLNIPISNYLPELENPWRDSITVHHLLTHTHGIVAVDKPLVFRPGTDYYYSQLGYELLAKILEKATGKTFETLTTELFKYCKMNNTFHPSLNLHKKLVNGYTYNANKKLEIETKSFENYVPAGGFVSTAYDLLRWNNLLHNGKLLKPESYEMMKTRQQNAVRNHPLFGKTEYGYGITVGTHDNFLQLGQTGFSPGFVSMNYYFPETKTSVILLENIDWDSEDMRNSFYYHLQILKIIRSSIQ